MKLFVFFNPLQNISDEKILIIDTKHFTSFIFYISFIYAVKTYKVYKSFEIGVGTNFLSDTA